MPTLSVEQTLRFAVSCRAPRANQRHTDQTRQQFIDSFMDVLGKVFGLERVFGTRVGNAQLRGVSGGEKKRVSISEVLASRALVTMWGFCNAWSRFQVGCAVCQGVASLD